MVGHFGSVDRCFFSPKRHTKIALLLFVKTKHLLSRFKAYKVDSIKKKLPIQKYFKNMLDIPSSYVGSLTV